MPATPLPRTVDVATRIPLPVCCRGIRGDVCDSPVTKVCACWKVQDGHLEFSGKTCFNEIVGVTRLGTNFFCSECFYAQRVDLIHFYADISGNGEGAVSLDYASFLNERLCGCGNAASLVAERGSIRYGFCRSCFLPPPVRYKLVYAKGDVPVAHVKAALALRALKQAAKAVMAPAVTLPNRVHISWKKIPTMREAIRMVRAMGGETPFIGVDAFSIAHVGSCIFCAQTYTKDKNHPLAPWLASPSVKETAQGKVRRCQPCWLATTHKAAMSYLKIVRLQHEREGGVRPLKEIAASVKGLTAADISLYNDAWTTQYPHTYRSRDIPSGNTTMVPNTPFYGMFMTARGRAVLGLVFTCHVCNGTSATCRCVECPVVLCRNRLMERCASCGICRGHAQCMCGPCARCRAPSRDRCEDHAYCSTCCTACANIIGNRSSMRIEVAKETYRPSAAWPRFLGFELETFNQPQKEQKELKALLAKFGWGVGTDGSVPRGREWRSCPVRGDAVTEQIQAVIAQFKSSGLVTNTACGLHIHVDAGDLTSRQLARTFVAWASVERRVFDVLAPARKGNRFCKQIYDDSWTQVDGKELLENETTVILDESGGELRNITFRRVQPVASPPPSPVLSREDWSREEIGRQNSLRRLNRQQEYPAFANSANSPTHFTNHINNVWGREWADRRYSAYVAGVNGSLPPGHTQASPGYDRYHSLNFLAYHKQKTLEFRLFEPRIDAEYILSCARLGTAVLEFGRYGRFTDLPKFEAKTKSKSTRLTYEKLMVWFEDHVAKVAEGKAPTPVDVYKKGVAE